MKIEISKHNPKTIPTKDQRKPPPLRQMKPRFNWKWIFKSKPLDYNINPRQFFAFLFAGNERLIIKRFLLFPAWIKFSARRAPEAGPGECKKGEIIKFATAS